MKLIFKDALSKEKGVCLKGLEPGQIFIDHDGDYCMKITPEVVDYGETITAVAVSGACIGDCLAYDGDVLVVPVKAELTILGYE